jgi:predicted transcriptional regulator
MEKEYITLTSGMAITEAVSILMEQRVTGAPVIDEEGHVLGLLSEKECLRSLLTGAYDRMPAGIVSDFMLKEFIAVPSNMGVFELAELMVKEPIRRFMVVDDDKLVGQITRRDLLRGIKQYWV